MWKYKYQVPKERKIRYIVHTDCKNEADDQYTLAHALMMDKFDVVGIIAGHFDKGNRNRFPEHHTAEASLEEVNKIIKLMGLEGQYPVFMGANTGLRDEETPINNEAVSFIIEEAMKDDYRPLYIGMQGAITDLASAILIEPKICERMTCIWIGGGDYPNGGGEFNLMNDINGANVVFHSNMPLWQVPKSTYKHFETSLAELQLKVEPCGEIGKYLFDQMVELNNKEITKSSWPHGEMWSLGDEGCIAALLQEEQRLDLFTMKDAPYINADMTYSKGSSGRKIKVFHDMDVRLDMEDLFAKLKINFG